MVPKMLESKLRFLRRPEEESQLKNITYVKIDSIRPNPYQPRKQFKKEGLDELCESIRQYGVLQPINVRKISAGRYELVAGERRLRAAKLAGLTEIPTIVVNVDDNNSAVMALIENLQRENLSYMEEAESYNNLINEHNFTQEELARKIGKSQSTIANKIRLLRLPPMVKKILADNGLTERHARALLKLHDEQLQLKALKIIVSKGLNVKKSEEVIEKIINKYAEKSENKTENGKLTQAIKDIRIFVNTIKQAVDTMKQAGVRAKAAHLDKGDYVEFIIRIPKKQEA
jgi:ParB family chromosome partitioning protein